MRRTELISRLLLGWTLLAGCHSPEGDRRPASRPVHPSRLERVGEGLYHFYCTSCHGEAGEGDGIHGYGLDPAPANLADTSRMRLRSDAELLAIIHNGGSSVGRSAAMPAWGGTLSRNQERCIIEYLRHLPAHADTSDSRDRGS